MMKTTTTKMPQLSEHAENGMTWTPDSQQKAGAIPGIAISGTEDTHDKTAAGTKDGKKTQESRAHKQEEEEGEDGKEEGKEEESGAASSSASPGEAVTPSMPDAFLAKLGLLVARSGKEAQGSAEAASDSVSDSKLESRFNSLALAFRTDRLTLDRRLGIQESSRDLAEQNVDREIHCLRDALQALKPLCGQGRGQEVVVKMGHHLEVLEHSIARVSTRAEVLGAVQQEKRMCLAMEVMINYTERIRRLRDTEVAQLDTARKILDEKGAGSGRGFETGAFGAKAFRRRSEIVLPRMLGGGGMPSLQFFSGMKTRLEPKQRFQTATANISVQNLVASALRHGSGDRQKKQGPPPPPSASIPAPAPSSFPLPASFSDHVDHRSLDPEKEKAKQHALSAEEAPRDRHDSGASDTRKEDVAGGRNSDAVLQSYVSGAFSKPLLPHSRDPLDVLQHRPSPETESSASSISEASIAEKEAAQTWLPAHITLRHLAAGVIFLFALAVLVVTFVFSPNVTSQ